MTIRTAFTRVPSNLIYTTALVGSKVCHCIFHYENICTTGSGCQSGTVCVSITVVRGLVFTEA